MQIKNELLTNRRTRPYIRKDFYEIKKLKGIVIHWTANTDKGADAMANRNFFNTTDNFVSAHYIVDDKEIIRCIPDSEVAYHVGGKRYTKTGEALREDGLTPNYFLIGIEMCVNKDGNFNITEKKTIKLVKHLMLTHNLTIDDVYRHYDITGKKCPKMYINKKDWKEFKRKVNRSVFNQILDNTFSFIVNDLLGTINKIVS